MDEEDKKQSLILANSSSLIRTGNAIALTNKLLSESKYNFFNQFKGLTLWNVSIRDENYPYETKGISKIIDYAIKNQIIVLAYSDIYFLSKDDGSIKYKIENLPEACNQICLVERNDVHILYLNGQEHLFKIYLYDNVIIEKIIIFQCFRDYIMSWDDASGLVYIPDYNGIAIVQKYSGLQLLDINTNERISGIIKSYNEYKKFPFCICWENKLYTINGNHVVQVFSLPDLSIIFESKFIERNYHYFIALNPRYNIFATTRGSRMSYIEIFSVLNHDKLTTINIESGQIIRDLKFIFDFQFLYVSFTNGGVEIYDSSNFEKVCNYLIHKDIGNSDTIKYHIDVSMWPYIRASFFDSSGKVIFTGDASGNINKWN